MQISSLSLVIFITVSDISDGISSSNGTPDFNFLVDYIALQGMFLAIRFCVAVRAGSVEVAVPKVCIEQGRPGSPSK